MSAKDIYSCSFEDFGDNPSITRELLTAVCETLVSTSDIETGRKFHQAYFESEAEALNFAKSVASMQSEFEACGIRLSEPKIEILRAEDWTEAWKKHFTVMKISKRIVVKPGWLEYLPSSADEIVLDIDPGMSFGTGKHPTTQFCLQLLEMQRKSGCPRQSLIDLGCGSGILTLAAIKLGYNSVIAIDNDPEAIEVSKENLAKNGISEDSYKLIVANLAEFYYDIKFDVVVANILSGPLIENKIRISSLLAEEGTLILSGILENEYDKLKAEYESIGFFEMQKISDGNWTAASFRRQMTD